MCAGLDLHLEQLDVKIAFLLRGIGEEIHMLQPKCFVEKGKENYLVCKLTKSLYGLKHASRCWYKIFDSYIKSLAVIPLKKSKIKNKNKISKIRRAKMQIFKVGRSF